jgi:putative heme iron utilization protein
MGFFFGYATAAGLRIAWQNNPFRLTDSALTDTSSAIAAFRALRDRADGGLLSTLSRDGNPAASYAPLVWLDGNCYLFLSELASHTRNLMHCPAIGLMLLAQQSEAGNAFARPRITLQGEARVIARDAPEFERVLALFHRKFGKVMTVIEPLPDFHLFRVSLSEGIFVLGFGQAYELSGDGLDQLNRVEPG